MAAAKVKSELRRLKCISCFLVWETRKTANIYCPKCRCDYGFEVIPLGLVACGSGVSSSSPRTSAATGAK